MRNFYRQHKTTRERIDNLAQRLSRKAGRKVSSREVLGFAESRKFFPEVISGHRCFPIGVADIIFEEMPLEVPAQVEAPAVEQPEGVLPGFPAPAPVVEETRPAPSGRLGSVSLEALLAEIARRGYDITITRHAQTITPAANE